MDARVTPMATRKGQLAVTETEIAQVRFGYGFGPQVVPATRAELLDQLYAPEDSVARYPGLSLAEALTVGRRFRDARQATRRKEIGSEERYRKAGQALRQASNEGVATSFARVVHSRAPFRERLTWFWTDHFTVAPRNPAARAMALNFVDDAIRPHVSGTFAQMLKAVIRHPAMLFYLDQFQSIGPASPIGVRTGKGLNENLARELLELHTLGAGSGYTQQDVRAAAKLLTGLSIDQRRGFTFRRQAAQPGAETVLGKTYGSSAAANVADIDAFLEDLAARPETARHLSQKLAVHFVADDPPESLVSDLTHAYQESGGDLGAVARVLVEHPEGVRTPLGKVKTPFEFIASSLIALGMRGDDIMGLEAGRLRRTVERPMAAMGQPFMRPSGPDGWPENARHWISPQGLATRISWAVAVADRVGQRAGDPRLFLERTLKGLSGAPLRFAVSAAETQAEGIALVLASAEFNRR